MSKELGIRPKEAANMEFWEDMLLLDGFLKMQQEAESDPNGGTTYTDYDSGGHDPRFPRSTDRMASPEELIALGVQYELIE